jgi:ABC-type multidrug transport system fused ATPase/permease subunit
MGLGSDISPIFLTACSLGMYSWLYGDLEASVAFTALSLFMNIEGHLSFLPMLMIMAINAKVSIDRVEKFMLSPDKPEHNTSSGDSISFRKATISFASNLENMDMDDDKFVMRDLSLEFPNGELSVIVGPTGSGKSLIMAAILGEAEILSGDISVPRSLQVQDRFDNKATAANWIIPSTKAFVSQTPWIENNTIKDNILFGLPFDPVRYGKVIDACALTQDLSLFDDRDLTEVGEQGVTLSGGQKWRLTLARAFYSRAGIIILDDVFSALDAHVGKYIYEHVLSGELAEGRTRILVTHHIALVLPNATYVVSLGARGNLEHAGLTEDLKDTGDLEEIVDAANLVEELAANDATNIPAVYTNSNDVTAKIKPADAIPKKLVKEEERATGRVKFSIYAAYIKATGGTPIWMLIILVYGTSQALILGRSWWLRIWSASYGETKAVPSHVSHIAGRPNSVQTVLFTSSVSGMTGLPVSLHTTAAPDNNTLKQVGFYLGVYVGVSILSSLASLCRLWLVYRGALTASRMVFEQVLFRVLHTPLRWLDIVPTGRILNRFTGDFQSMDSSLSMNMGYTIWALMGIIGIMAAAYVQVYSLCST